MKNSTPIVLDRLDAALRKQGVRLKRMQLLQVAASAFGHRNTHEMAAADEAGDLRPPEARYMGRTRVPNIGRMYFFQEPDGAVFAIDEDRFDAQEGRAADWLVSPLGGLLDVSALRGNMHAPINVPPTDHPTSAIPTSAITTSVKTPAGADAEAVAWPLSITNACREVPMPMTIEWAPEEAAFYPLFQPKQPIDPEQPAYMTNACCDAVGVDEADLAALGLAWGSHEGAFYPLTDAEIEYISEDVVDAPDGLHGALMGYSVLYRGAKHCMPTIEIAYQTARDAAGEFQPRTKVVPDAAAYADRIAGKVAAIGGRVIVEDEGLDRVLVKILAPMDRVMALGDFDAWKARLAWIMVDPDLPGAPRKEVVHEGDRFRASVSWIGEGEDGDYDPMDPADRPLLRFDADELVHGQWEAIDGGSYCTRVPAWCSAAHVRALARHVVDVLEDAGGATPRRLLEQLSWIDLDMVETARQQQLVVDAMATGPSI